MEFWHSDGPLQFLTFSDFETHLSKPYNLALSFLLTAGHDTDSCRKNRI